MIEKIRKYIQEGEVEKALYLLNELDRDTIVLTQEYKNAERSYNLGLIDYSDFARTRNRVTYAAAQFLEDFEEKQTAPSSEPDTLKPAEIQATKPETAQPATLTETKGKSKPFRVFLSYSQEDQSEKMRLDSHFASLKRSNLVEIWHDGLIPTGVEWDDAIKSELERADVILLLISANFIASDYIWDHELPRALERHALGSALVIPIFLKACDWQQMPFAKLQGLPRNGTPIYAYGNLDLAMRDVVKDIRERLERFSL